MVTLLAGQASVWVQPDGPNTEPKYLGCHEVGDIEESLGDLTLLWCPDPARAGKFAVSGSYTGEPDAPTVSISTIVSETADWLEKVICPVPLFIHKLTCGRRDLFGNFVRTFIMDNARVTSRGLTGLAAKDPGNEGESGQSFDFSAEALLRVFKLNSGRQSTAADQNLLAVSVCADAKCADSCGPAKAAGEFAVVVGEAADSPAAPAVIYITVDGGVTWTAAAADPFAAGEDISAVVCFSTDGTTTRIIVARGTTDAGNPAEIAYSDDLGATWTLVNVGSTNAQYVLQAEGLFALDPYHIWLVTSGGYVYFSGDMGGSWTAQHSGTLSVANLTGVRFASTSVGYAVGVTSAILKTEDGGTTWDLLAVPAGMAAITINAVDLTGVDVVWLGYANGVVWYTMDGGVTFAQRTMPFAGGSVQHIDFVNELVGFLLHNTAGPVATVYRTIDGGYDWEAVALPTNAGAAALFAYDINEAYVVGAVQGVTAFIAKVFA